MRSISISVMPKDGESDIPIAVAGDVLRCIQNILTHIGEYTITKELKLQSPVPKGFSDMFTLYMDPSSGITMKTSAISTSRIVDDALLLLERVLTGLGSGAGGYWIDDTFSDPRYRRLVIEDVMELSERLGDDHYLKFTEGLFDNVNTPKLKEYMAKMSQVCDNATSGIIRTFTSKSGREDGLRLETSNDRVRISFLTQEMEDTARSLIDQGVIVAGRIKYSKDGISDVSAIGQVVSLDGMKFKRMISPEGDVMLTTPLKADIVYNDTKKEWNFRHEGLGINVSKGTWDEAMIAFHDYFVFLWNTYSARTDDELSLEEMEIKGLMKELVVESS